MACNYIVFPTKKEPKTKQGCPRQLTFFSSCAASCTAWRAISAMPARTGGRCFVWGLYNIVLVGMIMLPFDLEWNGYTWMYSDPNAENDPPRGSYWFFGVKHQMFRLLQRCIRFLDWFASWCGYFVISLCLPILPQGRSSSVVWLK